MSLSVSSSGGAFGPREILGACREGLLGAVDLLWPPECCVCGQSGDKFFCEDCREQITPIVWPYCSKCGRPGLRRSCPDCGEAPWKNTDACIAMREVAEFDGLWRTAIHKYKYEGMKCLTGELAGYLTSWLDAASVVWKEADCVVPIPGRFARGWELGYHHANELAVRVAMHLNIQILHPIKRLPGPSQKGLPRDERIANAPRLYALKKPSIDLSDKTVLLIDDVVTTGATAHAAAALLKSAGASKVRMLALARSV